MLKFTLSWLLFFTLGVSVSRAQTVLLEDVESAADLEYQWLYEKIFPLDVRLTEPERSFKSFRVHLKDSYQKFIDPQLIARENLKNTGPQTGKVTYVGFFPKAYRYDVSRGNDGEIVLKIRVHLKKPQTGDLEHFRQRIQEAQAIWNQSIVSMNFKFRFEFSITEKVELAHFSVNIKDSTRGPYDTNWSRSWSGRSIAHEVGHMLGLGDEYKTLSGESDCYEGSLMCDSHRGQLMGHHFYFILRRLIRVSQLDGGFFF